MELPVYFDYAATTPVDARVADRMTECLTDPRGFGNPASKLHAFGRHAEAQVNLARQQVAALIGAAAAEIVWNGCADEPSLASLPLTETWNSAAEAACVANANRSSAIKPYRLR